MIIVKSPDRKLRTTLMLDATNEDISHEYLSV